MDEFTTAAQEPDEAMQEPFEELACEIEATIDSFATENPEISVKEVLKALTAVIMGFLEAEDDEDDEDEDDESEV